MASSRVGEKGYLSAPYMEVGTPVCRTGTEPKVEKKCPLPTVPLSASVLGEAGFVVKEGNRLKVGTGPAASLFSDLWG